MFDAIAAEAARRVCDFYLANTAWAFATAVVVAVPPRGALRQGA